MTEADSLAPALGISASMVVFGLVCAAGVVAAVTYRATRPNAEQDRPAGIASRLAANASSATYGILLPGHQPRAVATSP